MSKNHFKEMQKEMQEALRSNNMNSPLEREILARSGRFTGLVWQYNKNTGNYCMSEIRPKSKLSLFISKVKKWIN